MAELTIDAGDTLDKLTGMAPEPGETGLRARKKRQTRRALRESAAGLFVARGFTGTTVADIAAAANVSERTFFRYFDSKEALLLPDSIEMFASIEAELTARPADEDPFTAVGEALLTAAKSFGTTSLTALARPLEGTEALIAGRLVLAFAGFEERLTVLVERRLPPDTPDRDLRAAVIACASLSAVRAVLRTQRVRGATDTAPQDPMNLLPGALGFLSRIGHTTP